MLFCIISHLFVLYIFKLKPVIIECLANVKRDCEIKLEKKHQQVKEKLQEMFFIYKKKSKVKMCLSNFALLLLLEYLLEEQFYYFALHMLAGVGGG